MKDEKQSELGKFTMFLLALYGAGALGYKVGEYIGKILISL